MALPLKKIVASCALALSVSIYGGFAFASAPEVLPPTEMTGFCGWIYPPSGPVYIFQCGGTFSATNVQWQQDIGWLGQVEAAASEAIQSQQQADQTAKGKQLTAQDNNLAATQKEQNAAVAAQNIAAEYPSATIKLPDGSSLSPTIPNACESSTAPGVASSTGADIAVANAAANTALHTGALTAADVSASRPWDAGDDTSSLSDAMEILANDDGPSALSALSDLLEPDMTGILANNNATTYIHVVNDPTPPPQLSTEVQNTPAGKSYLAEKRVYDADMSLSNSALFFLANNDIPTISIATIQAEMTANATSATSSSSSPSSSSTASASSVVTAAAASAAVSAATSSSASQGSSCGSQWNTGAGTQGHITTEDAAAIENAHNVTGVSRRLLAGINMHEGGGKNAACNAGACGGFGERAEFVAEECEPQYGQPSSHNAAICGGVDQYIHESGGVWYYNDGANGTQDQISVTQQALISAAGIQYFQRLGGTNPARLAIGYGDSTSGMNLSGQQLAQYYTANSTPVWVADYSVFLSAFYHCPYSLSATGLPNGYGPNTVADAVADAGGGTDWPAPGQGASMPDLTVSPSSPGFIKDLLRISQNQGVSGYASINTLLEAYSQGYFLSPTWYTQVAKNAGNPSFYYKTSSFMRGVQQEIQYLQNRTNQYKTALLAQMYALKVHEAMDGKLKQLRTEAETSH